MAPKKEKGPKQLLAASQLTAFLNVYKAACKRYGVAPEPSILEDVEKKLLDFKPLEKVSLRGPAPGGPPALAALLDGLAGYAPVRNLMCWGANIGDQGLLSLATLMRGAADRFWPGSRLRLIEVVHDGADLPPDRWPGRYLAQANGVDGMVSRGPGMALPSLPLGHAPGPGLDTALLQQGGTADLASLERQLANLLVSCTSPAAAGQALGRLEAARGAAGLGAAGALGPGGCEGLARHPGDGRPLLRAAPQQAWSPEALSSFALALGSQGHMLQVLVLDHNQLGDVGARLLAAGLRRCASLQQLSLQHCGIGPPGAAALADSLAPQANPALAELQPKYTLLALSGNPLCAAGVAALAAGLRYCPRLKALHLAGVELGSGGADLDALQALADALAANTAITQIDLDANEIGDVGATVLLPFLQSQSHLRKLRLTPRLARPVMAAVQAAVRDNLPKPKKKLGLKKKKK